ncbi:MAG: hypothetical protein K6G51_03545 [Sphaerochaetaceae bacterium]|nr:hypothetical protein [Sphaerochaetaceae bacterium]
MNSFVFGKPDASTALIQLVDDHDLETLENEVKLIDKEFFLIALKVEDWNRDLSPWKAEPVFGKVGFGGEAEKTLAEVLGYCNDPSKSYYIGGYSLAGLFALWASYQTDIFSGVAAASPSIWFPGFDTYAECHEILTDKVYLSLGDREEKTRNPIMATVGDKIRNYHSFLERNGIKTILEWNEGNHFKDADIRTAKAFNWVLA